MGEYIVMSETLHNTAQIMSMVNMQVDTRLTRTVCTNIRMSETLVAVVVALPSPQAPPSLKVKCVRGYSKTRATLT